MYGSHIDKNINTDVLSFAASGSCCNLDGQKAFCFLREIELVVVDFQSLISVFVPKMFTFHH